MRKKLISTTLSLLCMFLLANSLVAKTNLPNNNSNKAIQAFDSTKLSSLKFDRKFILKFEYLNQLCETARGNCLDAQNHFGDVMNQVTEGCTAAGYDSDYCGELRNWAGRSLDWVIDVCTNYNY